MLLVLTISSDSPAEELGEQEWNAILSWSDEVGNRNAVCVVYLIYAAENRVPNARSKFRLIGSTTLNQYVHADSLGNGVDNDYVIVAFSRTAGQGLWGFGADSAGNPTSRF